MLDGDREMLGLHSCLAGGGRDATSAPAQRHSDHHCGDGEGASEESGAELEIRGDMRVRQVARKHPGSLAASTIVSFARQAVRELRTLAAALDALMSGQIMTAMDISGSAPSRRRFSKRADGALRGISKRSPKPK